MEQPGGTRHGWENQEVEWAGAHESKQEPSEFSIEEVDFRDRMQGCEGSDERIKSVLIPQTGGDLFYFLSRRRFPSLLLSLLNTSIVPFVITRIKGNSSRFIGNLLKVTQRRSCLINRDLQPNRLDAELRRSHKGNCGSEFTRKGEHATAPKWHVKTHCTRHEQNSRTIGHE